MCPLRYIASSTKSLEHPYYILHFSSFFNHFAFIRHTSRVFLLCISSVYPGVHPGVHSGTHSVLHLRSYLTFGTILPRILEQVPCPRCSTFILFFITFHFIPLHSISFHILLFERFMKYNVSFHMVCRLRYTTPGVHPAPIPFFIFGPILPSVQSYRGF